MGLMWIAIGLGLYYWYTSMGGMAVLSSLQSANIAQGLSGFKSVQGPKPASNTTYFQTGYGGAADRPNMRGGIAPGL